jgi:hypothetical protein
MEEVQATARGVRRRHGPHGAIMEEAGASHPGSVGSGSEAGGSNASAGAQETEVARVARKSKRTRRSSHGCPDATAASSVAGFSLAKLL